MANERLLTGVDLGGTKISAVVLNADGREQARHRIATPRDDYAATIHAICALVRTVERAAGVTPEKATHGVGLGIPGSINTHTGLVQNANSVWLNGRPLHSDLGVALGRPVTLANDANCLALSEAADGAAAGAANVFAVILGTGIGGGLVIDGKLVNGPLSISGEWGHTPLPVRDADELPGPRCWCGRDGCIETWLSGPGLSADHARCTGETVTAEVIATCDTTERTASLERHINRLARALSVVVNLTDPHVIVLGGGLSNVMRLYERLPALMLPHIFCDNPHVNIVQARHGDDSGVRGAARLFENGSQHRNHAIPE